MGLLGKIKYLDEGEILSDDLFFELLQEDNEIIKARYEIDLRERAKTVGKLKEFDTMLSAYISEKSKFDKNTIVCENGTFKKKEKAEVISFDLLDIMQTDLPPIEYLVKDFIAEGLTLLTAKSKSYKSWFCTQLCRDVSNGDKFLGMETMQCDCVYIDLEENPAGLKQRIQMQLNGKTIARCYKVIFEVPTMDKDGKSGFIQSMEKYLTKYPTIRLMVIDVYAKIKMQKKAGITDYDADYQCLSILKKFAQEHKLFMILVSHNRKMVDEDDVFSNILGSTALMGTTDECIVIHRKKRTDTEFTISTTGRTIPSNEYKARFNTNTFNWEMLGDAEEVAERRAREEYENSPEIYTIKKLLAQNNGSYRGKINEIIQASQYFEKPIHSNSTTIGKKMHEYIKQLKEYDCISVSIVNNGTGSKIYEFKEENPFTS